MIRLSKFNWFIPDKCLSLIVYADETEGGGGGYSFLRPDHLVIQSLIFNYP